MNFFQTLVVPFLVFWLIFFVAISVLVEFAQNYLYDETTPNAGFKVLLASALLAVVQTWARTSFETMFTSDFPWTVLQAIIWFVLFTLILRFHPVHALAVSLGAMIFLTGMSGLAYNSLSRRAAGGSAVQKREVSKPLRKSIGSNLPVAQATKEEGSSSEEKAETPTSAKP